MYGNICFEKSMKNVSIEDSCDCPMECNSISYSFSVTSTKFDESEMCGKRNNFMDGFNEHKFPPQYIRELKFLKKLTLYPSSEYYCRKTLNYRAEVIFRLATDSMPVTVMSSRLSFFDKMSDFGKCMFSKSIVF